MAALIHRAETGQGQFIDVSQTQTLSATTPEALMEYAFDGKLRARMGNRDVNWAPQGTYPCYGEDRWISISVRSDAEWHSLCAVLDRPRWGSDARFADVDARRRHHDLLDEMISTATATWDADALQRELQARRVPAGAVLDGKALLFDDHLRERGFFEVVPHAPRADVPPLPYAGRPWRFGGAPGRIRHAAPTLGQHNDDVLRGLLGMSESRVNELAESGVIGTEPANANPPSAPSNELLEAQGRIVRSEDDYAEQVRRGFGTG